MSVAGLWCVLNLGALAASPPTGPVGAAPGSGPAAAPATGVHPELKELLDLLVAAAAQPENQRSLLDTAAGQGQKEDKARAEAIEAASRVSRSLASSKIVDPAVHRALFTAAFSLDPATRRWAGEAASRVRPDTPAASLTPPTGGGQPGAMSGGGQPGAMSGGGQPDPSGMPAPPGAGPRGQPNTMSPVELAALRRYKDERLRVSGEVDVQGGGASLSGGVMASTGTGGVWFSPGVVVSDPVETVRSWAVYQGPARLEIPQFLTLAGETDRAAALTNDIHRAERASKIWLGAAGVGLAGVLTGVVGMAVAEDPSPFARVTLAGSALSAGGFIGASFPLGKATRLTHDYAGSFTPAEASALATKHNDALAAQLGLSPDQVWELERGAP